MDSARKIVVVPAGGICSRALRETLGLSTADVNPLLGDEICQPRDYKWNGSTDIFNVDGVRRLVRLLGLEGVDVFAEGEELTPRPEPIAQPRGRRGPWWQKDLSED